MEAKVHRAAGRFCGLNVEMLQHRGSHSMLRVIPRACGMSPQTYSYLYLAIGAAHHAAARRARCIRFLGDARGAVLGVAGNASSPPGASAAGDWARCGLSAPRQPRDGGLPLRANRMSAAPPQGENDPAGDDERRMAAPVSSHAMAPWLGRVRGACSGHGAAQGRVRVCACMWRVVRCSAWCGAVWRARRGRSA